MTAVRLAVLALLAAAAASPAAQAVVIGCDPAIATPGGIATVQITLQHGDDEPVAGTQNDLKYDPAVFTPQMLVDTGDPITSQPNCTLNPAIADKELDTSVVDGPAVRALVVSTGNTAVIPEGNLYTCAFAVGAEVALGDYQILNQNLIASDPTGKIRFPVTGTDCAVSVVAATPTPQCRTNADCPSGEVCIDGTCRVATPTPTPNGFCNTDQDCPAGEVCVDHHCVTPTPTPQCENDADCPAGQVCANGHCVTPTPQCRNDADCPAGEVCVNGTCQIGTPTPKRHGGSSGCGCVIDPGAPPTHPADALAVLVPALVVVLRWRSRRRAR